MQREGEAHAARICILHSRSEGIQCDGQPAVFIDGCRQDARLISGGVKAVLVARSKCERAWRKDQVKEGALD